MPVTAHDWTLVPGATHALECKSCGAVCVEVNALRVRKLIVRRTNQDKSETWASHGPDCPETCEEVLVLLTHSE